MQGFLEQCETHLIEEKVVREQCERIDHVRRDFMASLRSLVFEVRTSLKASSIEIKGRLSALGAERRECAEGAAETLGELSARVAESTQETIKQATEMAQMDDDDTSLQESLTNCKQMLTGLL